MNVLKRILPNFFIKIIEFWYVMWLMNFSLRYTNDLKWVLPQRFLIKLLKIYNVMGLRKFHVRYRRGLYWLLPKLYWNFFCVLGLRKLSLWYMKVLKLILQIFFIIVIEFWYVMWIKKFRLTGCVKSPWTQKNEINFTPGNGFKPNFQHY